jgi:plasmid maintenance system antidote protein VapI
MSIHSAICDTIATTDQSMYQIAKGSGVDYGTVYRFVNEQADVTTATADKLADYLGLTLQPVAKTKRKRFK